MTADELIARAAYEQQHAHERPWSLLTEAKRAPWIDSARAALAALDAAGLAVVPKVPDDKMEHVGGAAFDHPNVFMGGPSFVGKRTARKLWAAMVAAATSAQPAPKP